MRTRRSIILAVLLTLAVPGVAEGEPRPKAPKKLPAGATIAGVDVSGQGPRGAERALRTALRATLERPLTVQVGAGSRVLWPRRAGLVIHHEAMVQRAFRRLRRGQPVAVPLSRSLDAGRLGSAVRGIGRRHFKAPRDARVRFGITRVVRIRHRMGRGVDAAGLRRALVGELLRPTPGRLVTIGMRTVEPAVTLGELRAIHHTFVSVDRRSFRLRLFKGLRHVRTYRVAVGAAGYDTPSGLHAIQAKAVDPAWYVPRRPWAGALAGQVIPSNDPRNPIKARFLAIGNGVGIHGTAEGGSIGSRASHGCIRMRVRDVKLLYGQVPVGTPVLIR